MILRKMFVVLAVVGSMLWLDRQSAMKGHAQPNPTRTVKEAPMVHHTLRDLFEIAGQATPNDQPAEKKYKNIQVFKGLPSSQLLPAMFFMRGALGVRCTECHVNFTDFEKDDNPNKQTARKMIQMVRELNQNKFGGERAVTCNTCHRGNPKPVAPLAFAAIKNQSGSKTATTKTTAPVSTVDEVFERYIAATGGKSAHERLTNSEMVGSMLSSEGWTAPLKILTNEPNKMLITFEISWLSYRAFNGVKGWSQDNNGLHDVTGANLALLRREGALFQPMRLREQYASLIFAGKQMLDDREAYVVEGVISEVGSEKLYFDADTGLLVRITSVSETALGAIPRQIDLEDYRAVDGVMLPFMVLRRAPDFSSEYKIASVKHNVPSHFIDFDKPAAPLKSALPGFR